MKALYLLFALASMVLADEWNVSVEARIVELPQSLALPLLDEIADPTKAIVVSEKLAAWVADGTAELKGVLFATSLGGTKISARSETAESFGTEYQLEDRRINAPREPRGMKLTYPTVGVDTRDIGCSMAFETVISEDGRYVSVAGNVLHSERKADQVLECAVRDDGAVKSVSLPVFSVLDSPLSCVVKADVPTLAGIHLVAGKARRVQLHVVTFATRKIADIDSSRKEPESDPGEPASAIVSALEKRQMRFEVRTFDYADVKALSRISSGELGASDIQGSSERGESQLIAIHDIWALEYRQVSHQSVLERRYPTANPSPHPPQAFGPAPAVSDAKRFKEYFQVPLGRLKRHPEYRASRGDTFTNPPTTFEVENLGSTFRAEIKDVSDDYSSVTADFHVKHSELAPGSPRLIGPDYHGEYVYVMADKTRVTTAYFQHKFTTEKWAILAANKGPAGGARVTVGRVSFQHWDTTSIRK